MAKSSKTNCPVCGDRFSGQLTRVGTTKRKKEMRRLRKELPEATYKEVAHGMHWALRHNHDNLNDDKVCLRSLFQHTPLLHQACTLREKLTDARRSNGLKRVDSLFRCLWFDFNGYRQFITLL